MAIVSGYTAYVALTEEAAQSIDESKVVKPSHVSQWKNFVAMADCLEGALEKATMATRAAEGGETRPLQYKVLKIHWTNEAMTTNFLNARIWHAWAPAMNAEGPKIPGCRYYGNIYLEGAGIELSLIHI